MLYARRISEVLLQGLLRENASAGTDFRYSRILTARENEILKVSAIGMPAREIARIFSLTRKTVERHRGNIMRKLDLHSRAELVLYAIRNKMIPMDALDAKVVIQEAMWISASPKLIYSSSKGDTVQCEELRSAASALV